MSLRFLLEIGVEEIPDWMIPGALDNLRSLFEETLAKAGVPAQSVRVDGTPRRLVLRAEGVPERQADSEELVTGPPKAAPPAAVAGFAKKQGITPDALAQRWFHLSWPVCDLGTGPVGAASWALRKYL